MAIIDGLPQDPHKILLSGADAQSSRLNTQFALTGTDPQLVGADIIVFLEYVQGTNFVVKDSAGTALSGTIPSLLDLAAAPVRLDGGVIITGTVLFAKGYYIKK